MTSIASLTEDRIYLKGAKEKAAVKVAEAKKAMSAARNAANRAVGQKLPNAAEAQEIATNANNAYKQAEKEYKVYNEAFQTAVKEENDAIKEKQKEDAVNEVLSSYDVAVEEDSEYLGIFYDEQARYVGFDIGIAGRAEASYNVSDVNELNDIIAKLTEMAQKMS
jgi:microsomal dipeptidase-like Zn-dependent dipeptidase